MKKSKERAQQLLELSSLLRGRVRELRPVNALLPPYERRGLLGSSGTDKVKQTHSPKIGDAFTPAIRSHPGFRWLSTQPQISQAMSLVSQQSQKQHLPDSLAQLRDAQVLEAIAINGAIAFWDADWRPRTFSTEDKRRAVSVAQVLQNFIDQGIWLSNFSESQRLEELLGRFIEELTTGSRRDYSGPSSRQKTILTSLADSLRSIGIEQRGVVEVILTVSPALKFSPSHRTIQRYVSIAFSR